MFDEDPDPIDGTRWLFCPKCNKPAGWVNENGVIKIIEDKGGVELDAD